MNTKTYQKYLNQFSEKISVDATNYFVPLKHYVHSLVIPMCNEQQNCIQLIKNIQSLKLNGKLLAVFVINHNENSSLDTVQNNELLKEALITKYPSKKILKNCFLINIQPDIDIIIFYMCSAEMLPSKQGVGLARKIGCDFIFSLINKYQIESVKWINSTDADVKLPTNYFLQLENISPKHSACIYSFKHEITENSIINNAIIMYENSLHQYVNGLKFAESPYAYHTIGSLITISSQYYPLVRGFPKLSGAEDFYMLNKLSKLAPILTLNGSPILIQSRLSDRVPFGTGPALKRIIENDTNYINQLVYPQICFDKLKTVISHINQGTYCELTNQKNVSRALKDLGFFSVINKIEQNNPNKEKRIQHIHHWFDAFKTLKFIRLIANNLL